MIQFTTKLTVAHEPNIMGLYSLPFFFHFFSTLFLKFFSVSFTLSLILLDLSVTFSGDFSCFLRFSVFLFVSFIYVSSFPYLSSSEFKYCVGGGFIFMINLFLLKQN